MKGFKSFWYWLSGITFAILGCITFISLWVGLVMFLMWLSQQIPTVIVSVIFKVLLAILLILIALTVFLATEYFIDIGKSMHKLTLSAVDYLKSVLKEWLNDK